MSRAETVGSLLADIANLINDGLRVLSFADKRQWGLDEREQVRALQVALDDAKKDFQELPRLLNGQFHYERDRKHESIEELKILRSRIEVHIHDLKDWTRIGGPINPVWVRETKRLQKELHRAQCRAARRIFTSGQEESTRCLGAFLVHRIQRSWTNPDGGGGGGATPQGGNYRKRYMDELLACSSVGSFERFGEHDIAFICDYCDGHIIWEDLDNVPSARSAELAQPDSIQSPMSPVSPVGRTPYWQATGLSRTASDEKQIVFAPVAIANHATPLAGDWMARLICPYCEEAGRQARDADDEQDEFRPEAEFDDLAALQEHLEWEHASTNLAKPGPQPTTNTQSGGCLVM